jgi:hypothetical protein
VRRASAYLGCKEARVALDLLDDRGGDRRCDGEDARSDRVVRNGAAVRVAFELRRLRLAPLKVVELFDWRLRRIVERVAEDQDVNGS